MDERNERNERSGIRFLLVIIIVLLVAVLHELNPDFLLDFQNWLEESTGSSRSHSVNGRNIDNGRVPTNGGGDDAMEEIDKILERYYDEYE